MEKGFWKSNEPTIITLFADPSADIKIYYKKRGSSVNFAEISDELLYRGDGVWEMLTSFPVGEYILKVDVDGEELQKGLVTVVSPEEYSQAVTNQLIRKDIASLALAIANGISGISDDNETIKEIVEIINGRI